MVYKHFRVVVLTRVLLLSATVCLLVFLLFIVQTRLYATMFIVALTLVYQVYSLIHYVEKTNRDLKRFLLTIKHEDFSQTFHGTGLGSSFDELKKAFNDVIQKFQETRAEKEEHFRYLQTVVQHVGIGLIAFQEDGTVKLFNTAAKKLLKRPRLKNIHELESLSKPLVHTLLKLRSGQKALIKIQQGNELLQVATSATEFRLRNQNFTLVSLQNIQSELEEKEIEAWQKLIRVLTHEIMNSVTPIASLASTINDMLLQEANRAGEAGDEEWRRDVQGGIETIRRRSEGLLHFVDEYRTLARVPTPNLTQFCIQKLFDRVAHLMQADLEANGIQMESRVTPRDLELTADPELVEQLLINIVKNAIEVLQGREDARIKLLSQIDDRGRIIVQVVDNGPGIPEDLQEKIFIPFFTTKKQGSGIGLSLSRQIMRAHRGTITVRSQPNAETVFTLRF